MTEQASFTFTDPALKRCPRCQKHLPLPRFCANKTICRPCKYQETKAYYAKHPGLKNRQTAAWILRNPEKVAIYRESRRALIALRPKKIVPAPKPRLTHAELLLRREAIRFKRERPLWIAKWVRRFTAKHGQVVAATYGAYMLSHPKAKTCVSFEFLNAICLPHDFKCLTKSSKDRIAYLNQLTGNPPGHVGWNCNVCNIFYSNARFFDVDHRLPRSKGGDGRRENMQIICPSCHRIKTCDDVPVRRIVDAEISPDQPEDATQPSCMRQNI